MNRIEFLTSIHPEIEIHFDTTWVGEVGTPERRKIDVTDKVYSVTPNFSDSDWCDLCMREGRYYMGGCCGRMSAFQDIINGAFRDGGYIMGYDLMSMGHYGDLEDLKYYPEMTDEEFVGAAKRVDLDPLEKLGLIYNATKDKLNGRELQPYNYRPESEKEIVKTVDSCVSQLWWSDLFETREEDKDQHKLNDLVLKAKLLEPLRKLLGLIEATNFKLDAFALVNKENQEIVYNRLGLCVYDTVKRAQEIMNISEDVNPGFSEETEIREVTISVEEGLVIRQPVLL